MSSFKHCIIIILILLFNYNTNNILLLKSSINSSFAKESTQTLLDLANNIARSGSVNQLRFQDASLCSRDSSFNPNSSSVVNFAMNIIDDLNIIYILYAFIGLDHTLRCILLSFLLSSSLPTNGYKSIYDTFYDDFTGWKGDGALNYTIYGTNNTYHGIYRGREYYFYQEFQCKQINTMSISVTYIAAFCDTDHRDEWRLRINRMILKDEYEYSDFNGYQSINGALDSSFNPLIDTVLNEHCNDWRYKLQGPYTKDIESNTTFKIEFVPGIYKNNDFGVAYNIIISCNPSNASPNSTSYPITNMTPNPTSQPTKSPIQETMTVNVTVTVNINDGANITTVTNKIANTLEAKYEHNSTVTVKVGNIEPINNTNSFTVRLTVIFSVENQLDFDIIKQQIQDIDDTNPNIDIIVTDEKKVTNSPRNKGYIMYFYDINYIIIASAVVMCVICILLICSYCFCRRKRRKLKLELRVNSESKHQEHPSKDTNLIVPSDTFMSESYDGDSPLSPLALSSLQITNNISKTSSVNSSVSPSWYDSCKCTGYQGIENCIITNRIIKIMKKFEKYHKSMENYTNIAEELFDDDYDIQCLKNDYNAIVFKHSDEDSFEYIYNAILQSDDEDNIDMECQLSQCRILIPFTLNTFFDEYTKDAFILSVFYSMHCNFLHSYDMGYRIKPSLSLLYQYKATFDDNNNYHNDQIFEDVEDIEDSDDNERDNRRFSKVTSIVQKKRHQSIYSRSSIHSIPEAVPILQKHGSKFISQVIKSSNINIPESVNEDICIDIVEEEEKKEPKIKENNQKNKNKKKQSVYSFGIRWYYWKKYKTSSYFVKPKFDNFKIELLKNDIYSISIPDWNVAWEKATEYMETQTAKKIKCNGSPLTYYYGMEKNSYLTKLHLLSVIFYCNYDNLQYQYSMTFRKTEETENIQDIKKKNSKFAHWSRLLREAVEIYGYRMRDCCETTRFYHGVNCELIFPTTIASFCGPTSLTTELAVAASFSDGDGLILELCRYGLDVSYFNCSWISRYSSEQEHLICGGYQSFKINSIMLSRLEHDYRKYIKAINIIQSLISEKKNCESKIAKQIKKIIYAFLLNKDKNINKMPQYVKKLWTYFCQQWNEEIIVSIIHLEKCYLPLKPLFFCHDNILDIEFLANLFVNAPKISIKGCYGNDGIILNDDIMKRLFNFATNLHDKHQLNQIEFYAVNESELKCKDAVKIWSKQFENINFILSTDIDNDGIISLFVTRNDQITSR